MKGLPRRAVKSAEDLAVALLKDAIKRNGKKIPVNDPDYAEAFGLLRGILAYRGNSSAFQHIRTDEGIGPKNYESVSHWIAALHDRAMRELEK